MKQFITILVQFLLLNKPTFSLDTLLHAFSLDTLLHAFSLYTLLHAFSLDTLLHKSTIFLHLLTFQTPIFLPIINNNKYFNNL